MVLLLGATGDSGASKSWMSRAASINGEGGDFRSDSARRRVDVISKRVVRRPFADKTDATYHPRYE